MKLGNMLGMVLPGQKTHVYVPDFDGDKSLYTGEYEDIPDTWDDVDVCHVQTSDGSDILYSRVGSGVLCIGIEHE